MSEQEFKSFELKVKPDEYGDLNKPLPETVPKPNVGCGIRNDECFGLIFAWIVAPEEAMDYDSVEDTVKDVRLSLMENMGLLECKNGLTAKGHKYIYAIRKIQETVQGLPKPEVSYLLNLNVNVGEDDYFVNGSFTEEGMTGARGRSKRSCRSVAAYKTSLILRKNLQKSAICGIIHNRRQEV